MESRKGVGGRPKGSRTKEYAVVHVAPVRCRKCECSEFVETKTIVVRRHDGIAPDGRHYNTVRHRKGRCADCGQWHQFIQYELESDG